MTTQINPTTSVYAELIAHTLEAGEVPMLIGKPGIGKSAYLQQTAVMGNLKYVDIRLSGKEAADIGGIPYPVDVVGADGSVHKRTQFLPTDLFPLKGTSDRDQLIKRDDAGNILYEKDGKTPKTYDGWLVNLEEFTSAEEDVQAACYQILLDKMVGQYPLEDDVFVVACGNGANDGAIAGKLGTAIKSRVVTIQVEADIKAWRTWAIKKGIHQYIMDYLAWKPEMLHHFDPRSDDLSFPAPRTWEKLSNIINVNNQYGDIEHRLGLGTIGQHASEFKNFVAYYSKLPKIADILKDPVKADMPTEIGSKYALTGVIAQAMCEDATNAQRVSDLCTYMERMDPELQVVTIANAFTKVKKLSSNKSISKWISTNAKRLTAVI